MTACTDGVDEYREHDEHVSETLRDWLLANGVDWDHVVAWPELEVTDEHILIEMIKLGPNGKPELCRGPEAVLTHLALHPCTVPVDQEWLAAYNYTRPKALAQRARDSIMRQLLHHPPAIMVGKGQTLVWVTSDRLAQDELQRIQQHLAATLPDINCVVVSGVDQVYAGPHVRAI